MPLILWTPNGNLDIATDPSDLPEQSDGKAAVSGAMTRCTNLSLDRLGRADTRRGSRKIFTGSHGGNPINHLIEQSGKVYAFAGSAIYEDSVSILAGLTDSPWSSALYSPYNDTTYNIYATNGTDRKRIENSTVYEWGIDAPTAAPTIAIGSECYLYDWEFSLGHSTSGRQVGAESGNYIVFHNFEGVHISGDDYNYPNTTGQYVLWYFENDSGDSKYDIVYTLVRKVGSVIVCESNPSDPVSFKAGMGSAITWPAVSDAQVTHVRIYRSLADTAGTWYFDSEYAASLLVGPLVKQDADLGTSCAVNHDRPPSGITKVVGPVFNGQIFALVGNLLYYSLPNQPEYWPANYYVEVGSDQFPLIGAGVIAGQLYVANSKEVYLISGTSATSYFPQPMGAVTGTVADKVFAPVKGLGIFHLGYDGLYIFGSSEDVNISKPVFYPIWEEITVGSIPGADLDKLSTAWAIQWGKRLYFAYASTSSTAYPDNLLVLELETKRVQHYQYTTELVCAAIDYTSNRLMAGDSLGYVWELEALGVTTDEGAAISWQVQTKEFVQFPMYFPRYARYDLSLNNGASGTGEIILSDSVKQTHTLASGRNTKKRLITGCTGTRLTVRLAGSGPVTIYGVQVE